MNGRTWKLINKEGLIWYTDGSKTNEGTGAGIYKLGSKKEHSFCLGLHTTVFQAEIYMSSRNAKWRTWKRATKGGISIFSPIAKQPLRHLIISR